ncbi:MAG: peptidoglycan-binding domain-containing protein [Pseudomonadota bacterium]
MKYVLLIAICALGACSGAGLVTRAGPEPMRMEVDRPPNAAPGTCWGRDVTPAIYETVTEQILLQPPEIGTDGSVRQPGIYKTETRQAIVRERREIWFETPCDDELTPDFVATVQRALIARGYLRGQATGELDRRTRRAIRSFQAEQGLDSAVLSLAAARQLGLVAVKRTDAG